MSLAMSSSVEGRTSLLPAPDAATAAPDDPQLVTCVPGHVVLIQVKFMKMVKRIRSLKVRPTAEGCVNVSETPVEAMKTSSVEPVLSDLPDPTTEKAVSVNPQKLVSSLARRSKMTRLWKGRPTAAERNTVNASDETPVEATKTSEEPETSILLDGATENVGSESRQKLGSLLSLSKRIRALVIEGCVCSTTEGVVSDSTDLSFDSPEYSSCPSSPIGSLDPEGFLTCPSSPIGSPDSQGYLTCPSSPAAGSSDSLRYSTCAKLPTGRASESLIDSTCASCESQKCSAPGGRFDSQSNSDCPTPDSRTSPSSNARTSPTGGISESRRNSTLASANSRRSPAGGRSESQRHLRRQSTVVGYESQSEYASSASSASRRFSTGARFDSPLRSSTFAGSESRRFSTGARICSPRYPTCASPDSRRYSNYSESEMARAASSKKVLKALLTPSMSLSSILSIICTEEPSLVSQSDSRVPAGSTNATRSSTEVLVRPRLSRTFLPSQSLDLSTIPTGPELDAPKDQDRYCDSNISWSSPQEVDPPLKLDSPTKEEPRQSISLWRSSNASIPFDHISVYVGSEGKRFVISAKVVTHQLFQKLLVSDNYKLEVRDDKISIVLLRCDADYFQRLLFLVDQGKNIGMEAYEGRKSVS